MPSVNRLPIIAGNWKMFKTVHEAVLLVERIKVELDNLQKMEVVICPPYTSLSEVHKVLAGSKIKLGAQNLHWEKDGAYTGEVSAEMLKDVGCSYVIIGHSERRIYFTETDESVNRKLKSVVAYGLTPIVCVGETLDERKKGKTFEIIKRQIDKGLEEISPNEMERIVIAYEPVWAIGTGKTATPAQAQEVHAYIRKLLRENFGAEVSQKIRIQYGGSVKPDNISALMKEPDIDGALVGGASLKPDSFVDIVRMAK